MNDEELLRAYVREGSQDAFAELVRRHVGLVYATALRQVRDPMTAQEIAQQVFCVLAQKARTVRNPRSLPAWLHRTAHQLSALHIRSEQRRVHREHLAAMNLNDQSSDSPFEGLEVWLDQALEELDEPDRMVLLLRYFQSLPIREVGDALGVSEAATKMRIHRALEKLRAGYARYGLVCSAAVLAAFLEEHARASVPEMVTSGVLAATANLVPEPLLPGLGHMHLLRRVRMPLVAAVMTLLGVWLTISILDRSKQAANADMEVAMSPVGASVESADSDFGADSDVAVPNLRLMVVDAESELPLGGVIIRAANLADSSPSVEVKTQADGVALVPRLTSPGDFHFRLTVRLEGYVSQWVSWSRLQRDAPEDVPTNHVIRLSPGIRIGGLVQDPEGRPIAGATVNLRGNSRWMGAPPRDRACLEDYGRESVTTDDHGRWTYYGMPMEWSLVEFRIQAPAFMEAKCITDTSDRVFVGAVRLSTAELLSERVIVRLEHGHSVTGRVVNSLGQPVPGARIVQNREWGDPLREANSAGDGSFRFQNLSSGPVTLTVQAPGYAATRVDLDMPRDADVVVWLAPGNVVRARVVDPHGSPVVGAEVQLAAPPTHRAEFWMRLSTDAEGRFTWDQVPGSDLSVVVHKFEFATETVTLVADGTEQSVVLTPRSDPPPLRILGRVLDAETGVPVERFKVGVGSWGDVVKQGEAGEFALTLWQSENSLEIRAPGYSPSRREFRRDGATECSLEFRLTAAEGWSGLVQLPDGRPVSGAEVALVTSEKLATLGNRRFLHRDLATVTRTDADGAFSFDPEPPEVAAGRMLVAVAPEGYAEHDADTFRPAQALTLQPWGRIEGVVRGRSTYPPGLKAYVMRRSWNPWMPVPTDPNHFSAQPDELGRFVIESVPPGNYSVGLVPQSPGSIDTRLTFQVSPGKTTRLEVPDEGVNVAGRLAAAELPVDFDLTHSTGILERRQQTPADLPRLRRRDSPSEEAFTRASQDHAAKRIAYWRSASGLSAWMEQRSYAIQLRPDGTWMGRAVPPGEYDLKVVVREGLPGDPLGGKSHFLKSVHPVRVGTMADGGHEPVLDLGPVPMVRGY